MESNSAKAADSFPIPSTRTPRLRPSSHLVPIYFAIVGANRHTDAKRHWFNLKYSVGAPLLIEPRLSGLGQKIPVRGECQLRPAVVRKQI